MVDRYIVDGRQREQLKAWLRAQGGGVPFREACRERGWRNRNTAEAAALRGLGTLYQMMNMRDFGRY